MKKTGLTKVLVVLAAVVIVCGAATAETSLKQLVEEGQMQWLAGKWKATTDEGETIDLTYRWALDGNAILVLFKMGDFTYQGMIYCVPGEDRVVEVGVDSKGGVHKGQWDVDWDGGICIREAVKADSEKEEMGMAMSKVDNKTMKMKLYGVEWGSLKSEPWATLELKRQPRAAKAKAKK